MLIAPYTYDMHMWNDAYNEMMDTATTLDFYRVSYEDEIARKELKTNLTSLETWAAYAHANQLLYEVRTYALGRILKSNLVLSQVS